MTRRYLRFFVDVILPRQSIDNITKIYKMLREIRPFQIYFCKIGEYSSSMDLELKQVRRLVAQAHRNSKGIKEIPPNRGLELRMERMRTHDRLLRK